MAPYDHIYRLSPPSGSARLWRYRATRAGAWFALIVGTALSLQTQHIAALLRGVAPLGRPVGADLETMLHMRSPALAQWYLPTESLRWMMRFDRPGSSPAVRVLFAHERVVLAVAVGAAAIFAGAFFAFITARARGTGLGRLRDETHGSAHFADLREVRAAGVLDRTRGIYLAALPARRGEALLRDESDRCVLVCGPPGSGKTAGPVLPTLLSDPDVSTVAFDVKGDLRKLSSGWAKRAGKYVVTFDPYDDTGRGGHWNPLTAVRVGTRHDSTDARVIATHLCPFDVSGRGGSNYAFRSEMAINMLTIAVLHVLYDDAIREKNIRGLVHLLTAHGKRSPSGLFTDMAETAYDPAFRYGWKDDAGEPTPHHGSIVRMSRQLSRKEGKELADVFAALQAQIGGYFNGVLQANTAYSDFSFGDLLDADRPLAIYITVAPVRLAAARGLIRLFFAQLQATMVDRAPVARDGRIEPAGKREVRLVLDECYALGKLGIVESAGMLRSYGMRGCFVFQDLGQIYEIYGREETLTNAVRSRVFFTPSRHGTAKEIADALGTTTRTWDERIIARNGRISYAPHRSGFPLMNADQVMRLGPEDALVLVAGHAPVFAKKLRYYEIPGFLERASVPAVATSDSLRGEQPPSPAGPEDTSCIPVVRARPVEAPPSAVPETPALGGATSPVPLAPGR